MIERRLRLRLLPPAVLTVLLFWAGAAACVQAPGPGTAAAEEEGQLVVLVHGLGRTELSMLLLARSLERDGYRVVNWGYSSTCCSVAELGEQLAAEIHSQSRHPAESVHLVGHSLGNIIIRWVLANDPPELPGRVVMLAPPNQGSGVADMYADWFGWLLEPLDELTTDDESTAREIPASRGRQIGIIAGEFDDKVSIAETRLAGAADHVVVPSGHTFIMNRADVHRLTRDFLRDGRFTLGADGSAPAP